VTSALHIYPSPFTHESRILKETRTLTESGLFDSIHIGAMWAEGLAEWEDLDARRKVWRVRLWSRRVPGIAGKLIRFAEWYARLFLRFRGNPPDFINCHSLSVLPLGAVFRAFLGSRVVYDTHELETETQTSTGLRKWLAKKLERALIGKTEAVIVVSESIAKWYRDTYRHPEVHVVRNVPDRRTGAATGGDVLRNACGVDRKDLLFICQGMLDDGRGIPLILDAFARQSGDRHVVFLGYGPMTDLVKEYAARHQNVHFHPAVPPHELLDYTSGADVGISLIENTSLSYYYSLPNKVFESIAAGVPVIVSDFPEMARLVDSVGCGWKCSVDAQSLGTLVSSLTPGDIAAHAASAVHAGKMLDWRAEERVLVDLYKRILVRPAAVVA
jgi:glycosyltransferase involved in cell wall biosynthesis